MNGLDSDVFAAETGLGDGLGDFGEVHWFFLGFEDDEDFIADVAGVDGGPAGETPEVVEGGELLGERRNGFDVVRVLIIQLVVKFIEGHRGFVLLDQGDDFVRAMTDGLSVAVFGNANGGVIEVVFVNHGEGGGNGGEESEFSALYGGGIVTKNALGEAGGAADAAQLGEVANNELLGGGESGDLAVGGSDAQPDQNGFFELADALTGDTE